MHFEAALGGRERLREVEGDSWERMTSPTALVRPPETTLASLRALWQCVRAQKGARAPLAPRRADGPVVLIFSNSPQAARIFGGALVEGEN